MQKNILGFGKGVLLGVIISLVALLALFLFNSAFNTTFQLSLTALSESWEVSKVLVSALVIGAVAIAILLAWVTYLTVASRFRAQAIAERMTQELSYSRAQLEVLYNNSPVPYFLLWSDGTIQNPNLAAVRFFNLPADKLEGTNFFSYVVEDAPPKEGDTQRPRISIADKLKHRMPINQYEARLRIKEGVERWVLLSIFSVETIGEHHYVGLASFMDITQQKDMDRIKSEFVSLASHQLRTPLSTVKWQVEMLMSGKHSNVNEETRTMLANVQIANERMIALVNDLLNVSRIDTGTVVVTKKETDMYELMESVFDEMKTPAEAKKLVMKKAHTGAATIVTDPSLLRIVLQNLVSNAVRYTPEGGTVEVKVTVGLSGCTISVKDNGIGIPNEQKEQIFTKMFRADNAKKVEATGTGLGLYMSKAFVDRLGGTMVFVSEVGKGSEFTVHLPIH